MKQFYLPERVRQLREARGLTKLQLAQKTSVTLMTVYRVENGQACSLNLLQRIADTFEVPLIDLLNPSVVGQNISPQLNISC